ncbi:MAG: M48 family metalloprotease [Rhodobacteraceae bacterium]|nr:M48 family metalloprotease [Paracoccaceae bacterium]
MSYRRGLLPASILSVLLIIAALPAAAVTLLRDADIERGLGILAAPILRAAGLSPARLRVLVVDDSALNAFVVDQNTIFLNRGLILKVQSAAMLQAVIAHEAAHIANGHIARRMGNMRNARTAAGLGLALAAAAAAAGSGGAAASGIALGSSTSALRGFLAHTRAEEAAADQSAARFMRSAGVSLSGLVQVHRLFRGQEALSVSRQDPYMRAHPLTRDRIRAAEAFVAAYGDDARADPEAEYWLARVRGKLSAFTRAPSWTLRRAAEERHADIRLMREAIAWHRQSNLKKALAAIDAALRLRGNDGYLLDLKGQILMENRQFAAARATYAAAAQALPRDPLVLGGLGRAQLATGQPAAALSTLERARAEDFRDPRLLRDMASGYAQTGQMGMAAVVTAERYALMGRLDSASVQARRAMDLLPRGSVGWRRAQDVEIAHEQNQKRRK